MPSGDATEHLVASLLGSERDECTWTLSTIRKAAPTDQDAAFRTFFPSVPKRVGPRWSNQPPGVRLAHYLFLGPPVIFDLNPFSRRGEPMSHQTFEQTHGLTLRAVEELVEMGRILPNLYARSPAKWQGMGHFEPLLAKSVAIGVRVEHFVEHLSGKKLEELRDERRDDLRGLLTAETWGDIRDLIPTADQEEQLGWLGYQWAYIDAFDPGASSMVATLMNEGRIREALELIFVVKRQQVSPYSAAIGGELYWGTAEIERWTRLAGRHPAHVGEGPGSTSPVTRAPPQVLQYLVHLLAEVPHLTILDRVNVEHVMSLQRRSDWQEITERVLSAMHELTREVQDIASSEDSGMAGSGFGRVEILVRELERSVVEKQRLLRHFEIAGGYVGASVAEVAYLLGSTLLPAWGALAGSTVVVDHGSRLGARAGAYAHKMARPASHRLLKKVDDLTSLLKQG